MGRDDQDVVDGRWTMSVTLKLRMETFLYGRLYSTKVIRHVVSFHGISFAFCLPKKSLAVLFLTQPENEARKLEAEETKRPGLEHDINNQR